MTSEKDIAEVKRVTFLRATASTGRYCWGAY